jgi:signal recognition particle subunit SRP54
MGDMLSLIEKAQAAIDAEKAAELERKMRRAEFTLEDFQQQLEQIKQMGPLDQLLGMLPGVGKAKGLKDLKIDEKQLARTEAIIKSMTREERENPDIINASRRKRIANGSGTSLQDVNRLLKQFEDMRKVMKQFSQMMGGNKGKALKKLAKNKGFRFPFG